MSGSRKVQRSVRVTVATSLLAMSALAVVAAVGTSTWVSAAAVLSVLAGATSSRIVYTEVVQTRAASARDKAAQARAFGETMTTTHREHAAFVTLVMRRIADRDRTIVELGGVVRLAECRADEAEQRVKRESQRANDAQDRLAAVLDELLTQQAARPEVEADRDGDLDRDLADLPTLVNLLAWEDKVDEVMLGGKPGKPGKRGEREQREQREEQLPKEA